MSITPDGTPEVTTAYTQAVPATSSRHAKFLALGGAGALTIALLVGIGVGHSSASGGSCKEKIGPFLTALQDVDSRLDVGIIQADYSTIVGEAAIKGNRILADYSMTADEAALKLNRVGGSSLSDDCKEALHLGLDVLGLYEYVNTEWNDCIFDDYCDTDTDVDFSRWDAAADELKDALAYMNG